jgi:MoxR-like ATPase
MDNIFLYLLGFAGTGKLTIARAFARSVGAKVVVLPMTEQRVSNRPGLSTH